MARTARKRKKNPARLSAEDRSLAAVLGVLARMGAFRPVAEEVGEGQVRFVLIDPVSENRLCIDDVPRIKDQEDVQSIRDLVCDAMRTGFEATSGMSRAMLSYYGGGSATQSYLQLLDAKGYDERTKRNFAKSLKEQLENALESILLNRSFNERRWELTRAYSESLLSGRPFKEVRSKPLKATRKKKITDTDLSAFGRYAAELKMFSSLQTQKNLLEASIKKVKERARASKRDLTAEERKQIDLFEESIAQLAGQERDFLAAKTPLGKLLEGWREYAGQLGSTTAPVGDYRFDIKRDGARWRGVLELYIISGFMRAADVKRELNDAKRQLASMQQLVEREQKKAKALGKDPEKESQDEMAKVIELEKQVATLSKQLDDVRGAKTPMRQTTFWMFWVPYIYEDPIDYKKTFDFPGADNLIKDAPLLKNRPMPSFKIDDALRAKRYLEEQVDKQLAWYRKNNIKPVFAKKGEAKKQEELEAMLATSGHPSVRKVFTDPNDWGSIVRVIQERKHRKQIRENKTLRGLESFGFKAKKRVSAKDIDVGDQIWFNNGWRTVYVVAGQTDRSIKLERGRTRVILRIEYAGLDESGRPSPRELVFDENEKVLVRKPRVSLLEDPKSKHYAEILANAQELMVLRGLSPIEKGQRIKDVVERLKNLRTALQSDLDAGVENYNQRKLIRDQVQEIDQTISLMLGEKATRDVIEESGRKRKSVKLAELKRRRVEVRPEPRKKHGYKSLEHRQEILERAARKSGKHSDLLRRVDAIDAQIKSVEAEIEKAADEYRKYAQDKSAPPSKRKEALDRTNELKAEARKLQQEKKELLLRRPDRPERSIKQLKASYKTEEPEENPMKKLTMRDPMFDMSTLPKTRRARKNIEKAYADERITKRTYDKLIAKADKAMEDFTDEALGLKKKNPSKNPRPRDVDAVLFEYKYREISKPEARKRLKALGLSKREIDGLLKYIGNPLSKNPTLAERRAARERARADIARARAEAARAQAEARSARSKRRVKAESEALLPRVRKAWEKYVIGEEEREPTEQELLSQATEIAEQARDYLDEWRESAVAAKMRGTMPKYNRLVAALLEALLAREAFARLDETTKANQMDTLRKRIQKEIVDIMEGRKTIGQVQKSSERLADAGESAAGTITAMGGMRGTTTGATVMNPGPAVHDKHAHKYAKRSVKKWEKYCQTGKCSDLVNAYTDMVLAHREFEYIGDKKSAKQIATGMKRARSEMTSRLKTSLKAA